MMVYRFFFFFICFLASIVTLAQTPTEQRERSALLREMDRGIDYMLVEKYQEADDRFLYVLSNIDVVPSNLTYHFGKNSYYLGKYQQSIDWLNKYIELRGTTGEFYKSAVIILSQAEEEYRQEQKTITATTEQVLASSYEIDCGPAGKVKCPVCKGRTVIIKVSYFSQNQYEACGFCDEHGHLTCNQYNQLLRGELEPRQ